MVNVPMTVQIVIIILEEQNVLITINFTLFVYATFSPNICLKKILCVGIKNCNMLATNSIYQTPRPNTSALQKHQFAMVVPKH